MPDDDKPDSLTTSAAKRIDKGMASIASTGKRALQNSRSATAKLQKSFGEDYSLILTANPLVRESLAKAPLLIDNRELLSTVFNLFWSTSTLWTAASIATTTGHHPMGNALGGLFHYGPGHIHRWNDINRFMDSAVGSGHRLKFGHSIDNLPGIVEQFGIEGVPAYFCHVLQDFTSTAGVPVVPHAWSIKQHLQSLGLSAKASTAAVSLSASSVLAASMIGFAIWKFWEQRERDRRKRELLAAAGSAAENRDYTGAIESYKRVLELDRDPATLMALGQVYLNRQATRPYAHHAFAEAVRLLGPEPSRTVLFKGVQISLRGIAGLQALATADVIGDRYPQYWQEQVDDFVHATINSFSATAAKLDQGTERRLPKLGNPPALSAAVNRYLAAQVACQYPLLDDRHGKVTEYMTGALRCLGKAATNAGPGNRELIGGLRQIWTRTVLPEAEAELMLAVC